MLSIHFLQQWFNMSDPQAEAYFYDSDAIRKFAGIDLGVEVSPDETTICKFRHLIQEKGIGEQIFFTINTHLKAQRIKVGNGTHGDATIITAPSSIKNNDKKTRSQDTPEYERQSVLLWHKGPYRSGS